MLNRVTVGFIYIVRGEKATVINREDLGEDSLFEKILSLKQVKALYHKWYKTFTRGGY